MDPLSISTSIVALSGVTLKTISFLCSVKNASSERNKLRDEVITVTGLLKALEMRLGDMKADDEGSVSLRALDESSALDRCRESLEELIEKTDTDKVSGIEKFGRKFTWHFEKTEVNKTLMSVERVKTLLSLALTNDVGILMQNIKVGSEVLTKDVCELKEDFKGLKIDKECQVIGDWLSPFDFRAMQQEILRRSHPGTGKWMLESKEFQQWSSSHNETLWCPGIPGAGKTYLASIVIDYLQRQASPKGQDAVLCLFCSFNEQANQTAYKFMGALLKQLAQASRTLSSGMRSIYDKRETIRRSDFRVLADTFRSELRRYSKTFIVIDALDEVSESADIRTMLLEELRSCPVNLLVTSRHDPTIKKQFSDAQHCEIHATDEDIRSYISKRMALESRLSRQIFSVPSLKNDIPARIVGSAKGMFLLARFHMDEISNKTKPRDIQDALKKPPQGLNDTYDRTIDRIKSQGSECWNLARKVLLWLSNALKPLSLGALQEAVAVETGMTSISIRDLDDTESLISACAGLVVLDGGKETSAPRLVHYTLQEYLSKNPAILSPNPHADVARACLAFLSFELCSNKPPDCLLRYDRHDELMTHFNEKFAHPYPFTCYAPWCWGIHAQRAGEIEVMDEALDFLSRPANVAYNWHVMMYEDSSAFARLSHEDLWKEADFFKMLLAVQFGLKSVLVELLKTHTRPVENALDRVVSRLACHAVKIGHKEIVRLLLTKKDVDWDMCGPSGDRLLMLVAGWNDEDILRTLLQKGSCSVNALSNFPTTPGTALHLATKNGCTSIARILLEAGADVEAHGRYCSSVIAEATPFLIHHACWHEMMDLLLEYKANINAQSMESGYTPLHSVARTSFMGTHVVVEYLVSKGAGLNLPDAQGNTPLDLAEGQSPKHYAYNKEVAAKIIQILREAGGKTAREMIESPGGLAAWEALEARQSARIDEYWDQWDPMQSGSEDYETDPARESLILPEIDIDVAMRDLRATQSLINTAKRSTDS